MKKQMKLILASQSPRRKQLLENAGYSFEIIPSQVQEIVKPEWTPEECVEQLAIQKAQDVVNRLKTQYNKQDWNNIIVLSADTIVAQNNVIFGKPKDAEDAHSMLWTLSHKPHRVLTGVCIWKLSESTGISKVDTTYITMRPLTIEEIHAYVASGESEGKAGAYAIQETADQYVEKLEGHFDNVVGLPISVVQELLSHIIPNEA